MLLQNEIWQPIPFRSTFFFSPFECLSPTTDEPTLRTTVLGVGAGAIASILYVLGQLVGNQSLTFVVLAFSVVFGFIAGFTFDSVFKRLESVQALKTDVLGNKNLAETRIGKGSDQLVQPLFLGTPLRNSPSMGWTFRVANLEVEKL
jgi:hypothetical protein